MRGEGRRWRNQRETNWIKSFLVISTPLTILSRFVVVVVVLYIITVLLTRDWVVTLTCLMNIAVVQALTASDTSQNKLERCTSDVWSPLQTSHHRFCFSLYGFSNQFFFGSFVKFSYNCLFISGNAMDWRTSKSWSIERDNGVILQHPSRILAALPWKHGWCWSYTFFIHTSLCEADCWFQLQVAAWFCLLIR